MVQLAAKSYVDRMVADIQFPLMPTRRLTPVPVNDYREFAFGFTVYKAVVTILTGKIRHGTRTPITVAETDITIADDNTWIFVEYVWGSGSGSIGSDTVEPLMTKTTMKWPLSFWRLANELAYRDAGGVLWYNDIPLMGVFA